MNFDFEKYRSRMEESSRRLEIARSFREPDRVPITISTAGSFYTRLFGRNIRDYYMDMDFQLDVQMKGLKWAFEELEKVFFSGGLNCRDLYGAFEEARPAVDRAIRVGAPGGGFALAVGGETYAGVNPDTLVKVVAYAKERGRYPIKADGRRET